MLINKRLILISKSLALLAGILPLSFNASATTINFDDVADGTNINTHYSGVTFSNPLGVSADNTDSPNIFARSFTTNNSPGNVVSVFSTGVPAFDARWGGVQALFSIGQSHVSIDAAILRLPEGLGTPRNAPKLEVYGTSGNFITSVSWDFTQIAQPDVGGITGFETLSYTAGGNDIGKVVFLSGQPGESPSNFGLFDNLTYDRQNGGTIPEPNSLLLLGLGVLGLTAGRLRRRERL